MPAGRYSFTIEQGATFSRTITYRNSAGVAVDLTGYSARMKVKSADLATTILDLVNTGATGSQINAITLGGAAGTVTLALTPAQTAALAATTDFDLVYDLEIVSAGGVVTRLLEGRVKVAREVTV